ncbi:hypothetical protein O2W15_02130 [Modestobacter sp. VKM Ac-2979]|uniref:hypothetical protein n=1 Tax=unclassified Modestobacter TaxID=2643866 RepID=UPI0022AB96CB|nr:MULTISPECIES: hypothetical protein [unclassified Modestobacter]MCZ2810224.1 hypothetical protein [Modestobacter sp. VKM Ac-2979]MCZ2841710.1 hypothetical protein [Modestobacter sp. VKM Ac-2980]
MKNAAALLADLIEEWTIPQGASALSHRRTVATQRGTSLWPLHQRAVGYLVQVERDLDALRAAGDDVDYYLETLPFWYEAVFSINHGWNGLATKTAPAIDPRDLRLLRALAGTIDTARLTPKLSAEHLADLRLAIDQATALITETGDDVLKEGPRRYLLGLVFEAGRVLEEIETFGTAALRSVTFELGGAMGSVAEIAQDNKTKTTWREASRKMLSQWSGAVPIAAITSAVDVAVKGITSG